MSIISEFAARQNAFNDQMDAAILGLTGDIKDLNATIVKLQNSPGIINAEDQALLDNLQSRGQSISSKLTSLDGMSPPVVPVS